MTRLVALALLVLAGCAEEYQSSPEDIAADAAYDAVADSGLEDRITGIEGRLDEVEASDGDHARAIEAIHQLDEEQAGVANDNDAMLDRRIRAIETRLGM